MKRLITISGIVVLILIACFLGIYKIQQTNTDMTVLLEQIISDTNQQDYQSALQTAESAKKLWEDSESIINTYVNHDMLDDVSENLVRLTVSIQQQNDLQIHLTAQTVLFQLDHIYECEIPLLKNIF